MSLGWIQYLEEVIQTMKCSEFCVGAFTGCETDDKKLLLNFEVVQNANTAWNMLNLAQLEFDAFLSENPFVPRETVRNKS